MNSKRRTARHSLGTLSGQVWAVLAALRSSWRRSRGQAGTGVIHGRVLGAGGGLLANASVTAKDMMTGVAVTKLTALDGSYSLESLPPAMYEVTAALCAYSAAVTKDVELRSGAGDDGGLRARLRGAAGLERTEADDGHLRLRDARHRLSDRPEPSRLVRRRAADEAPFVRERVRRGRALVRQRPPDPARRQGHQADLGGRDQDDVRVRALRHRCRRRPDDLPPAARLRRARQLRRRPDLEPVHGHRRLPELGRVLGTDRHGLLPQHPDPLDADPGRHPADARARTPGRLGRRRQLRRPRRDRRTSRAASPTPTSPASTASAATGATSRSPASCATSSGTTCSPTSSTSRAATSGGAST